jgi:hypothetical protein
MRSEHRYEIIAFPNGARHVVATLWGSRADADGVVAKAQRQAAMRGEYMDVERDGSVIAVVDHAGPIDDLPSA